MKRVLIFLLGILILACNQNKKEDLRTESKSDTLIENPENFDWLLGKWKRLNEDEGKDTFEYWEKTNKTEYSGIGFTMQNGDTIKRENIRLTKGAKFWNLVVKTPYEESIIFRGTSYTKTEFICENNEIEFPNRIKYWIDGNQLNATVSGGEMKISFEFEKLNK